MESLSILLQAHPVAATLGASGLALQLAWPLLRSRRPILAAQVGVGACYSAHYALLGALSGAGVAGIGTLQGILALIAGDRPWLRRSGYVFLPMVWTVCLATWNGIASACALAAITLIILGRLQGDTLRLRILMLSAGPFGMAHDIVIGSLPGLMGGIVSAFVASAMLVREIRERRASVAHDLGAASMAS